jgi:hypothetical protein
MNVLIIGFVLLSELSMGQYSFLYITMTFGYCSKRTGGRVQISLLGLV